MDNKIALQPFVGREHYFQHGAVIAVHVWKIGIQVILGASDDHTPFESSGFFIGNDKHDYEPVLVYLREMGFLRQED